MCRKLDHGTKQEKGLFDTGERKVVTRERDGTLKYLLKKSYLRRWIGPPPLDASGKEVDSSPDNEGKFFNQRSSSLDFARHVLILGACYSDFVLSMNDCDWLDSLSYVTSHIFGLFEDISMTKIVSFHPSVYLYSCLSFIRMKIENATLKESMESMEHLTLSIHRLRLSLFKVSYYFVPQLLIFFCI